MEWELGTGQEGFWVPGLPPPPRGRPCVPSLLSTAFAEAAKGHLPLPKHGEGGRGDRGPHLWRSQGLSVLAATRPLRGTER